MFFQVVLLECCINFYNTSFRSTAFLDLLQVFFWNIQISLKSHLLSNQVDSSLNQDLQLLTPAIFRAMTLVTSHHFLHRQPHVGLLPIWVFTLLLFYSKSHLCGASTTDTHTMDTKLQTSAPWFLKR